MHKYYTSSYDEINKKIESTNNIILFLFVFDKSAIGVFIVLNQINKYFS